MTSEILSSHQKTNKQTHPCRPENHTSPSKIFSNPPLKADPVPMYGFNSCVPSSPSFSLLHVVLPSKSPRPKSNHASLVRHEGGRKMEPPLHSFTGIKQNVCSPVVLHQITSEVPALITCLSDSHCGSTPRPSMTRDAPQAGV